MWGYTTSKDKRSPAGTGVDGSNGNQPRGTVVQGNICHEYGMHQKQSSCVFMASGRKSPLATKILLEDTDGLRRPP